MDAVVIVKIIAEILGGISLVGGIVFGFVTYINRQVKNGVDDFSKLTAERATVKDDSISRLIQALENHIKEYSEMKGLTYEHLNEIDLWRKEINGQIKMFGMQLEFGNKISDEQKIQLSILTASHQQVAISVGSILQYVKDTNGRMNG